MKKSDPWPKWWQTRGERELRQLVYNEWPPNRASGCSAGRRVRHIPGTAGARAAQRRFRPACGGTDPCVVRTQRAARLNPKVGDTRLGQCSPMTPGVYASVSNDLIDGPDRDGDVPRLVIVSESRRHLGNALSRPCRTSGGPTSCHV
jgi:hypothetical protein